RAPPPSGRGPDRGLSVPLGGRGSRPADRGGGRPTARSSPAIGATRRSPRRGRAGASGALRGEDSTRLVEVEDRLARVARRPAVVGVDVAHPAAVLLGDLALGQLAGVRGE